MRAYQSHRSCLPFPQIPPISKLLACGDVGVGAMENPSEIVAALVDDLKTSESP
eukprot:m.197336 g.197336  ORF g.197336 m.197336 type:complete len:54 (-) comp18714_c0_seq2:868-1029(-)